MNNEESGILSRTVNQTEAIEEEKVVAHCAGHRSPGAVCRLVG